MEHICIYEHRKIRSRRDKETMLRTIRKTRRAQP